MPDLIADMYRQNEWANLALLDLCRGLTEEQMDATGEGTFGSIRDTLRHIIGAEAGYAYRLGGDSERRIPPDAPWPGLDALADTARYTTGVFIDAAASLTDETVRVGSDDDPWDVEPSVILVQAFHHSTEHRSQVNTILTSLGIDPPELSGWEWGEADGKMRAAE